MSTPSSPSSTDADAAPPLLLCCTAGPACSSSTSTSFEPLQPGHHVVVVSLPGYRSPGRPHARRRSARGRPRMLVELMRRLGHQRFVVAGGDWGATIGAWMAAYSRRLDRCRPHDDGADAGLAPADDPDRLMGVTPAERALAHRAQRARRPSRPTAATQLTRPQTLAYGLTDSPAGLTGWIVEKFRRERLRTATSLGMITTDRVLDNLSVYWFTGTINSSMRLYHEATKGGRSLFPTVRWMSRPRSPSTRLTSTRFPACLGGAAVPDRTVAGDAGWWPLRVDGGARALRHRRRRVHW